MYICNVLCPTWINYLPLLILTVDREIFANRSKIKFSRDLFSRYEEFYMRLFYVSKSFVSISKLFHDWIVLSLSSTFHSLEKFVITL